MTTKTNETADRVWEFQETLLPQDGSVESDIEAIRFARAYAASLQAMIETKAAKLRPLLGDEAVDALLY